MQCLILAGGLGTRLGDLTRTICKPMVPVLGRPFAEHQLKWLRQMGVTQVLYSIGYRGEQLQEFVGDGARFGLKVAWIEDGPQPLGTGGPLRLAWERDLLDPHFLVTYGDSYLPIDFLAFYRAFCGQDCSAMMGVLRNHGQWGPSNALFEGDRVTIYRKGPQGFSQHKFDAIDYGVSAFRRELVAQRLPSGPSALEHLFEELSDQGELAAHEFFTRFYEVGSPQGIADLEDYLERGSP